MSPVRTFRKFRWAFYRSRRRAAWRRIDRLIVRHGWHNTVLDTTLPNVPFLRVVSLTVVNGYGQQHTIRTAE